MDTEKLLPLPGRDCGPETGHVAIRTDESILAWGRANLERAEAERDAARAEVAVLRDALLFAERHCPCGARPEALNTHPHMPGCKVDLALRATITDNRERGE